MLKVLTKAILCSFKNLFLFSSFKRTLQFFPRFMLKELDNKRILIACMYQNVVFCQELKVKFLCVHTYKIKQDGNITLTLNLILLRFFLKKSSFIPRMYTANGPYKKNITDMLIKNTFYLKTFLNVHKQMDLVGKRKKKLMQK